MEEVEVKVRIFYWLNSKFVHFPTFYQPATSDTSSDSVTNSDPKPTALRRYSLPTQKSFRKDLDVQVAQVILNSDEQNTFTDEKRTVSCHNGNIDKLFDSYLDRTGDSVAKRGTPIRNISRHTRSPERKTIAVPDKHFKKQKNPDMGINSSELDSDRSRAFRRIVPQKVKPRAKSSHRDDKRGNHTPSSSPVAIADVDGVLSESSDESPLNSQSINSKTSAITVIKSYSPRSTRPHSGERTPKNRRQSDSKKEKKNIALLKKDPGSHRREPLDHVIHGLQIELLKIPCLLRRVLQQSRLCTRTRRG